jgi:hypothetical protein
LPLASGRGDGKRCADLGPGGDGQWCLDLHRQRIEPGDAVQRRGLLDALAHAHVLLEHGAGNRRDEGEGLPAAVLGEGEFLTAFGGLGGALGRVGAACLQARFGDQAFAKELFVTAEALAREGRLGVGLDAVALQLERLRAGDAGEYLALFYAHAGGGFQAFDHPGQRRCDHPHLAVGNADRGRQAGGSSPAAGLGGLAWQCPGPRFAPRSWR